MRKPVVASRFAGKSTNGAWGDSLIEIDWSVGEILNAIRELNLDERTVVVFVSDNGAPLGYGGSNAPLGGTGYSTSEGGMRVPCIIRWPGRIPTNQTCDELCTMMDILPTFTHLAGGVIPLELEIDGYNTWPLWAGDMGAQSPYEVFYYYMMDQLQAVRSGPWKLHLELTNKPGSGKRLDSKRPLRLINLNEDLQEKKNVSDQYPAIVKRLLSFAEKARYELGDTGIKGSGRRKAGWINNPTPRLLIKAE